MSLLNSCLYNSSVRDTLPLSKPTRPYDAPLIAKVIMYMLFCKSERTLEKNSTVHKGAHTFCNITNTFCKISYTFGIFKLTGLDTLSVRMPHKIQDSRGQVICLPPPPQLMPMLLRFAINCTCI